MTKEEAHGWIDSIIGEPKPLLQRTSETVQLREALATCMVLLRRGEETYEPCPHCHAGPPEHHHKCVPGMLTQAAFKAHIQQNGEAGYDVSVAFTAHNAQTLAWLDEECAGCRYLNEYCKCSKMPVDPPPLMRE